MNLMQLALTHSSAGKENNERLEFLGDSVLNLIAAQYLFELMPDAKEGILAMRRAQLVNTDHLHKVAISLRLGDHLILGRSEECSGGRTKRNILADAVEAQIGAMYLEYGLEVTRNWVVKNVLEAV